MSAWLSLCITPQVYFTCVAIKISYFSKFVSSTEDLYTCLKHITSHLISWRWYLSLKICLVFSPVVLSVICMRISGIPCRFCWVSRKLSGCGLLEPSLYKSWTCHHALAEENLGIANVPIKMMQKYLITCHCRSNKSKMFGHHRWDPLFRCY